MEGEVKMRSVNERFPLREDIIYLLRCYRCLCGHLHQALRTGVKISMDLKLRLLAFTNE